MPGPTKTVGLPLVPRTMTADGLPELRWMGDPARPHQDATYKRLLIRPVGDLHGDVVDDGVEGRGRIQRLLDREEGGAGGEAIVAVAAGGGDVVRALSGQGLAAARA